MELLKQIGPGLAWLSGALAAITALLYGAGFVATAAHQAMLGLDWTMTARPPIWYLGLGGQVIARWAVVAVLAVIPVLLVGEASRRVWRLTGAADPDESGRAARAGRWAHRHLPWLIALILMVLAWRLRVAFGEALQVRDLLFLPAGQMCAADGVLADLAAGRRVALSARAEEVGTMAALALAVAGYAAPRLARGQGPVVPLVLCLATAVYAAAAVPTAHGVLLLRPDLRTVTASGDLPPRIADARLQLIARADGELWLWQPATGRVHWLPEAGLTALSFGPSLPPAALACPGGIADLG